MKTLPLLAAAVAALSLSACATAPGPVEVTRFLDPAASARLGQGTVFVAPAPGSSDSLDLAPYKAAVAAELARIGYSVSGTPGAEQTAEVSLETFAMAREDGRGPVSVGVGGSTGTYGSGVGLGVGINLGGGGGAKVARTLRVVLRDVASSRVLWEGRASFEVSEKSPLAQNPANAQTLAAALLRDFPGNNGETVQVKVGQ